MEDRVLLEPLVSVKLQQRARSEAALPGDARAESDRAGAVRITVERANEGTRPWPLRGSTKSWLRG